MMDSHGNALNLGRGYIRFFFSLAGGLANPMLVNTSSWEKILLNLLGDLDLASSKLEALIEFGVN